MTIDAEILRVARLVRTSDLSNALDSMGAAGAPRHDPRDAAVVPRHPVRGHRAYRRLRDPNRPLQPTARRANEAFAELHYAESPEGLWREASAWGAPDDLLVIDSKGSAAGILGSRNALQGRARGTWGFVIDGTAETRTRARSTDAGLLHDPVAGTPDGPGPSVSDNQPIVCAGMAVEPGDLIVADDDGVVVLPADPTQECPACDDEGP